MKFKVAIFFYGYYEVKCVHMRQVKDLSNFLIPLAEKSSIGILNFTFQIAKFVDRHNSVCYREKE